MTHSIYLDPTTFEWTKKTGEVITDREALDHILTAYLGARP